MWEKHRLRVFENRVMRKVFGRRRDEKRGEWRRLHNEECCGLYSSPNIIRVITSRRTGLAGHVACVVKRRDAYRVLMGKPDEQRPLGKPRR